MKTIRQNFTVSFAYDVAFTRGLFEADNQLFADSIKAEAGKPIPKVLFIFDEKMFHLHPGLFEKIRDYAAKPGRHFELIDEYILIPGGEESKNQPEYVEDVLAAIEKADLDRHSYVVVVGGGAVIDAAGYAAAIAHRGVRLIRLPTTVLAQNDAAIGVKNGVNAFGKKNFLGTFVPPHSVLNDFDFLKTLEDRDWRAGISEAVKVALIKDATFFKKLEEDAGALSRRDMKAMQDLIIRCAELHLEHISTSGDPFESGSSRPLDFGHWAAHKLEQLTGYELRHGEAVAIGIALDTTYSYLKGMISEENCNRIVDLFKKCGFRLFVPELGNELNNPEEKESILYGLEEFREHLGGELTIMLLQGIGQGVEVHEVDIDLYKKAITRLRQAEKQPV